MRFLLLLALLPFAAWATDPPTTPPVEVDVDVTNTQGHQQSQGQQASNNLTLGGDRATAVALAHGAPIPPQGPAGLIPGRRGKRGLVAGVVALSAVCVAPPEAEAAAMQVARDHELAMARLGVEAAKARAEGDRAATERICAESSFSSCGVAK
jgi:hypothetical protein